MSADRPAGGGGGPLWPGWIPPAGAARAALWIGLGLHVLFVVSLKTNWLDVFFLEAVKAYGQAADYFGIHQAGQNLLDGHSIYDSHKYRTEADLVVPYFYFYRYLPPTAYVAALGAALFDPWTGYWVWIAFNELLLGVFLWMIWRLPGVARPAREAFLGIFLGFSPFYLEQWMGQYSFLMAFLLWLLLREEMLATGRDPARGAVGAAGATPRSFREELGSAGLWGWAGSVALKSYSALFGLVDLLRGRWRRVLLAAGLVLLACLPYYLLRPADVMEFLRLNLKPLPPSIVPVRYGPTAAVLLLSNRIFGWEDASRIDLGLHSVYTASIPVYLWIGLVGLVAAAVTWRTARRVPPERLFILWTLSFFCVYKDVWEYHHVMLLPALLVAALTSRSRFPWVVLVWLALPTANVFDPGFWSLVDMRLWSPAHVLVHHVFYAVPVLLFWIWTARWCLGTGRSAW